jgi:hypothetical protein
MSLQKLYKHEESCTCFNVKYQHSQHSTVQENNTHMYNIFDITEPGKVPTLAEILSVKYINEFYRTTIARACDIHINNNRLMIYCFIKKIIPCFLQDVFLSVHERYHIIDPNNIYFQLRKHEEECLYYKYRLKSSKKLMMRLYDSFDTTGFMNYSSFFEYLRVSNVYEIEGKVDDLINCKIHFVGIQWIETKPYFDVLLYQNDYSEVQILEHPVLDRCSCSVETRIEYYKNTKDRIILGIKNILLSYYYFNYTLQEYEKMLFKM